MPRHLIGSATRPLTRAARPAVVRGYAEHATPQKFNWQDPLASQNLLTEEELAISETAESYCQERMLPRVLRKSDPTNVVYRVDRSLDRGI